jgi:hypothetical protein
MHTFGPEALPPAPGTIPGTEISVVMDTLEVTVPKEAFQRARLSSSASSLAYSSVDLAADGL